jgi:hypothetical protein
MIRINIIAIALLGIGIASCSESVSNPDGSDDDQNGVDYSDDYMPLQIGAEWWYTGGVAFQSKITDSTMINGKHYRFWVIDGAESAAYRKEGDTYYLYDPNAQLEFPVLKERPAGETWTWVYHNPPPGDSVRIRNTVVKYEDTRTVDSVTFRDVLHLLNERMRWDGTEWQVVRSQNLYYARGIGLVEETYSYTSSTIKCYDFNVPGSSATVVE